MCIREGSWNASFIDTPSLICLHICTCRTSQGCGFWIQHRVTSNTRPTDIFWACLYLFLFSFDLTLKSFLLSIFLSSFMFYYCANYFNIYWNCAKLFSYLALYMTRKILTNNIVTTRIVFTLLVIVDILQAVIRDLYNILEFLFCDKFFLFFLSFFFFL